MKRHLLILLMLFSFGGYAQNLVPNYSFEIIDSCPELPGQLYYANGWFSPFPMGGSVDLYHTCASYGSTSVPANNNAGHQFPKTGSGYVGFATYGGNSASGDIREYLEVKLLSPLIGGKLYCIEAYVNVADTSGYASDNIGFYFSTDSLIASWSDPLPLSYEPQFEASEIITDKVNWTLLSGQFTATGNEQFLTIGNFRSNTNTNVQVVGNPFWTNAAYYLIDDISVECCDPSGCDTASPQPPAIPLSVPTILSNNDIFYIRGLDGHVSLTLYDARGRLVYENAQYINDLPLYQFSEGIYFYRITLQDGRTERGKVMIVEK